MLKLVWDPSFETGNATIDRQHRRIVDALSALPEVLSPAQRRYVFTELSKHVSDHFAAEERVMNRLGYPGYVEHKAQHDALLRELLDLQQQLGPSGARRAGEKARDLLRQWLIGHLGTDDAAFAEFARNPPPDS